MPSQQLAQETGNVPNGIGQDYESLCQLVRQPAANVSSDVIKTSEVRALLDQFDTMRQLLNSDPESRHIFADYDHRLIATRETLVKTTTDSFPNSFLAEKLQGVMKQACAHVEKQIDCVVSDCKSEGGFINTILEQIPGIVA